MNHVSVINSITDSKKYRDLYSKTIDNVCNIFSYNEKKIREKLHQIWGAYYSTRPDFKKLIRKINTDQVSLEDLLKIHSSTKERIGEYKEIYGYIFENVVGDTIADLGCGFNPIFLILLNKKDVNYVGYDIDSAQQEFLNNLFGKYVVGFYKAILGDVLVDIIRPVDIVFAFKLLPVLDQVSNNQTDNFLINLDCKYLVVSFPNKSLGGREKGMKFNYKDLYIPRLEMFGFKLINFREFVNESVYIFIK